MRRLSLLVLSLLPGPAAASPCDFQALTFRVQGSLSASLVSAIGEQGSELSAHLARIFMWDLDLRRDVVGGDEVRLLWRASDSGEMEIGAATYRSQRLGRLLAAYRFRPAGDQYPSYWDDSGVERQRRLKGGPLDRYQEITALLKDRPTHQGMDFKTPVGTEVRAPREGSVGRVDWKRQGNGRCVELRYDDGTTAKFLHLSEIKVRPGARVRAGQVIALSGNTGHSTAPHLHYQLSRGPRTLDPVDYHGVFQRRLKEGDLSRLRADIAALHRACGRSGEPW
jgi:murein DD-endopeptidase